MKNNNFEKELIAFQSKMLNFAFSLTLNREDAEDLLQETILRALDNKEKFVNNVNLRGWLITIMKNIFRNNYRKIVTQNFVNRSDYYNLNSIHYSSSDNPEGSFATSEIINSIALCADEYRIPFSMHMQGFKYEEIAKKNNLPIGTVKSRIFMARKSLKEQLKDYRN